MSTPSAPQADTPLPPKVDPDTMTLRAPPRPVVRLNRRMLALGAGTLAAAVLGGAMWSLQSHKRESNPTTELYNVDRVSRAESLDQLPKDYSKIPTPVKPAVPVLGEPLPGDLGPAIVSAERQRQANVSAAYNDPAHADRLTRLRDAEEAARSTVFFRSSGNGVKPVVTVSTASAGSPSALVSGNQSFNPMGPTTTTAQPGDPTTVQNRQEQKAAFVANAGDTATRNLASLQMPASPYQVMAGTVIPAALVTGINSDLPGQVMPM